MHEDDSAGFWALMFWKFHGLGEKDPGQFIGQALAARYDETSSDQPAAMDELVRLLEAAEQSAPADNAVG